MAPEKVAVQLRSERERPALPNTGLEGRWPRQVSGRTAASPNTPPPCISFSGGCHPVHHGSFYSRQRLAVWLGPALFSLQGCPALRPQADMIAINFSWSTRL